MKVVYFTHSLLSCWNHGNAHFVRGVLSSLERSGHRTAIYEPVGAWSLTNLLADYGEAALDGFHTAYPQLTSIPYDASFDPSAALDDADLVIVHEWNDPDLVASIGALRQRGGRFLLFFHDTHHRAVSAPEEMRRFDLDGYDGILAFGEALSDVYREWGWAGQVLTWHEAADIHVFKPPAREEDRKGLVWIGNWGDGERSAELERFLFRPARDAGLLLDVHGVRYPPEALAMLQHYAVRFGGWVANAKAPRVFATHLATAHVPRRFYVDGLPGIPTIRVFEALACGIPLLSAPWRDSEGLFRAGKDFLMAGSEEDMLKAMRDVKNDPDLRSELSRSGLETIRERHTCEHRVGELIAFAARVSQRPFESVS